VEAWVRDPFPHGGTGKGGLGKDEQTAGEETEKVKKVMIHETPHAFLTSSQRHAARGKSCRLQTITRIWAVLAASAGAAPTEATFGIGRSAP